ncbi:MAG TPA: PQQ-dependent sugar dehydrogenase, partial [Acidimicrobiia bacterium]
MPVLAADPVPDGFTTQDITNGLVQPVAFGFTPAGRLYVAEKRGTVQVFDSVSDPTPTQVVDVSNNVHDFWDRGLLGLAVDPEFGSGSDYIYLLYSYDPGNSFGDDCANPTPPPGGPGIGCVVNGQLSRFPINPGGSAGVEQVLLTGRWCAQFPSHTIGDLAFTEEGHLLVTGGDGASFGWADHGQRGNPCGDPMGDPDDRADDEGGALRSQDLRTGADPVGWEGTVLRINKATGAAVDTNPASQDSRIIAHGLRNPFRLTVRPNTSEVWIGDVGWSDWEEIDRITNPGGSVDNFGWPCYEGNNSGSAKHSSYDALDVDICEDLYDAGSGSVVAPFYARPHGVGLSGCPGGGGAISGLAFYEGGNYPNPYDGALFIADYSIACIRVMFPDASFGVPNKANISTFIPDVTAVDLQIGPGGDLYYADITTGRIVRVNYSNAGPTADIQADPTTGSVPLQVSFDGTGSTDPEGDALTYAWDLDGDTQFDDSTNPQPTWTYTTAGPVTVRLRVTDPFLGTDTETIQISPVANQAPVASITAPVSSLTWRVEEMISFSGSATDGGAPLPASALSWEIVLNHCQPGRACHEHVIQNIDDVSSGTFTAPDHAYPSFLTIRLIATDTGGLTDEDEVSIQPETTVVTIASNPSGAQVQAGVEGVLDTFTAPVEITAIVGGSITVNAPSAQTIGGIAYSFSNWSDGGAPSHTISAPAPDTTLTANFVAVGGGGSGGG